jgi:hypothetical protein
MHPTEIEVGPTSPEAGHPQAGSGQDSDVFDEDDEWYMQDPQKYTVGPFPQSHFLNLLRAGTNPQKIRIKKNMHEEFKYVVQLQQQQQQQHFTTNNVLGFALARFKHIFIAFFFDDAADLHTSCSLLSFNSSII